MSAGSDVAVIGAGVLGLACGAELARRGRSVVVLEQHDACGRETSSRNSEVIHAGLYDPPGSLKASSCVLGRDLLYERCEREGLPHRRIGKLVVATEESEQPALERLAEQAEQNGAGGVRLADAHELRQREPRVRGIAALWSPDTGVVDAHSLLQSYHAELEKHGGSVALRTQVIGLRSGPSGWRLDTRNDDGARFTLDAGLVVNAAGLGADRVAAWAGLDVDALGWRVHPCKGDYFSVAPGLGALTHHLVYPLPRGDGGLGVHTTLDLSGRVRLGPDATWVDTIDYHVDPEKAEVFAAAVRRYLPEVTAADLSPEMSGIRPKLGGPEAGFRDFVVEESSASGAPGIVHLVGIESPGLTAAGALARRAGELLLG